MAATRTIASPAELADRLRRYGAEWAAAAVSTELANRPRAEAAIRHLFRAHGRTEPQVAWVPSPTAGLLAASAAAHSRTWMRGTFTRGEVGTGGNQPWRALAEPFDLDPSWQRRLLERGAASIRGTFANPDGVRPGHPTTDVVRALGLDGVMRIAGHVRTAAGAVRPTEAAPDPGPLDPVAVDVLAVSVLGDRWASMVGLMGTDLARDIFAGSVKKTADEMIASRWTMREAVQAMQLGQFDVNAPSLAVVRDVFGRPLYSRRNDRDRHELAIDARLDLARSAGPWWAFEGLAIVAERPLVAGIDDDGRLHGEDGPALAWGDGSAIWAWHGVEVDPSIVLTPEAITVEAIDTERNVERRRVLVERFGEERLLREGGAELVDEDATGRLWRREMSPSSWSRDEDVVMVEVVNSTPEADGTRRSYFLRVPPMTGSARDAVAWTFGLPGDEYRPDVET